MKKIHENMIGGAMFLVILILLGWVIIGITYISFVLPIDIINKTY